MHTRTALAALVLTILAAPLAVSAPVHASGGDAVRTHGGCDGSPTWTLKAKPDDGRIEVEAEVDSNRAGQLWDWRLKHNGSLSSKGSSKTAGTSGSFSVQRRMADLGGTDHFTFRAERRSTGQVCRGTIAL